MLIFLCTKEVHFEVLISNRNCRPDEMEIECNEGPLSQVDEESRIISIYCSNHEPREEEDCNDPAIDYVRKLKVPFVGQPLYVRLCVCVCVCVCVCACACKRLCVCLCTLMCVCVLCTSVCVFVCCVHLCVCLLLCRLRMRVRGYMCVMHTGL